jgi:hypothetical protein
MLNVSLKVVSVWARANKCHEQLVIVSMHIVLKCMVVGYPALILNSAVRMVPRDGSVHSRSQLGLLLAL